MNILIPDSWLREYLETEAEPEVIAREVSLCGPSVERIEEIEGETVYDIEVTTNRVDTACVRGFAREAAVILQAAGIKAKFLETGKEKSLSLKQFSVNAKLKLPKISLETEAVKRILTVVLDQVKETATPPLMAKRLRQIGENVHTSVIDITNYITHELGHPCHAFDYDKVMALGGEIRVKQADKGKKFVTLDGVEHQTVGGEVVFESKTGEIIDLPAIKGTANTAIDENTQKVLFWLENMDAKVVRQASMSHAIRTVAAILNEKNVDPTLASEVMARGLQLFQQICQAQIASQIEDKWPEKTAEKTIKLSLQRLSDYLGVNLAEEKVKQILQNLGFAVTIADEQNLLVMPPSFRSVDVKEQADVIEEVARIYGYAKIEGKLDFAVTTLPKQDEYNFALEGKMSHFLAGKGLSEVYTYSMVSEELAKMETGALEEKLRVSNPLNDELVYLRQKLIPSLAQVYKNNLGKTNKVAGVFEVAKTYFAGKKDDQVKEELHLAVVSDHSYRQSRAWLEQLLALAYIKKIRVEENTGKIATENGKETLGLITILPDGKVAWELNLLTVVKLAAKYPHYQALNNKPMIIEDLTFVFKSGQAVGPIIEKMTQIDNLIKNVALKDVYEQNYTFTYQYQGKEETISNLEVAPVRAKIVEMMQNEGCELVGKI